ncbi:MAG TPA: peptidase T [Lachnospiraceae bacterium]|jgi:tripeptide aminopeptidase|nr:peptidase T [Lachnospiraceae bacterium]HBE08415.1 peptidase T [Lachnospiraceae bacterium]
MKELQERFLKYITTYTTSDEESETVPSAARELDLAHILTAELTDLGVNDVILSKTGYVYGHIPATPGMEGHKSVAFIAHMDTAPDYPGENVNPVFHENYDGSDVVLEGTGAILSVKDFPELETLKGRTLITTDGTTLLGADDKAGVAEIMTMTEKVLKEDIPHGDFWVVFTPDEEIGRGSDHFDFDICKADYGYTVDGDYEGEVAYENFNAASAIIKVTGKNVHPGEAKNIMKNASLIGTEFASLLPADETPATTEGREGFYHLIDMKGEVASATLTYIIRDHDHGTFENRKKHMMELTAQLNEKYGEGTVECTIKDSYANMIEIMKDHMDIIEGAKAAIQSVGLEPISRPIRGGTDGAMLTFKGLPCPNLGTSGYGFHGPFEHCTIEGMETVVTILTYLASHPL